MLATPSADPSDRLATTLRRLSGWATTHWRLVTAVTWITVGALWLWWSWARVRGWGLLDTDDNLRLQQVRDWLGGQGWFDLRQRRLGWPDGFNIHWSRLVDLPLAGLMLGLKPFVGAAWAERLATGIAPLLPLSVLLPALALIARRLVAPAAFALALLMALTAPAAMQMMQPTRVDHHGWQLAFLLLLLAGLVDPQRRRGGVVAGLATALSLTIGLEMLPYLALGGGAIAARWIVEPEEEPRLTAYGMALAPATLVGFLAFASYTNRQPMCDALSPVWLTVMLAAGGAAVFVGLVRDPRPLVRLGAAALGGVAVAAVLAIGFPQCLGAPEHASPELQRLWLSHVREAKPIQQQDSGYMVAVLSLPILGLLGLASVVWRELGWRPGRRLELAERRAEPAALLPWLPVALLSTCSVTLLFWQARAGPAAQLLAVPGAVALIWLVAGWIGRQRSQWVRIVAIVAVFLLVSGIGVSWLSGQIHAATPPSTKDLATRRAGARCPLASTLHRLDALPPARFMTFVDLGPRLLVTTHHAAVAGPYHRNGQAILDVHHFFGGPASQAHAIVTRRGDRYVLICPNMAESTLYEARNRDGMYVRLAKGRIPDWLVPVALPPGSPLRLFRVVR